jgi:hypothetical protein
MKYYKVAFFFRRTHRIRIFYLRMIHYPYFQPRSHFRITSEIVRRCNKAGGSNAYCRSVKPTFLFVSISNLLTFWYFLSTRWNNSFVSFVLFLYLNESVSSISLLEIWDVYVCAIKAYLISWEVSPSRFLILEVRTRVTWCLKHATWPRTVIRFDQAPIYSW